MRKQRVCVITLVVASVVTFFATYNVMAADVTMTTDPTDFYWEDSLGDEGTGIVVYDGEIYWCNRANVVTTATYKYDNIGWWIQVENIKGESVSFLVYEEDSLIKEETVGEYGYYLYKISRDKLIEGVKDEGFSAENFFVGNISVELDGYVQLINGKGTVVAGPYDLRKDTSYNTLIKKMNTYEFSENSIYTVTYELRNKIVELDSDDVLLKYNITFYSGTTDEVKNMPENGIKIYGEPYSFPDNIPIRTGYVFLYWLRDDNKEKVYASNDQLIDNEEQSFTAVWEISSYDNVFEVYAEGFQNGEGTTESGENFLVYSEKWEQEYNTVYQEDGSSFQELLPNGYYFSEDNQVNIIYKNGNEEQYSVPYSIIQLDSSMSVQLYCEPYEYDIIYELDGGATEYQLIESYNVLYGVTFPEDISNEGHAFVGWTINDEIVTGINEGADASFTDAEELYTQLNMRQIGDVTVIATWDAFPELSVTDVYMYLDNEFDEERFYQNVVAMDEEDGDLLENTIYNKEEIELEIEALREESITEDVEYQIEIEYAVEDSYGNLVTEKSVLHLYALYDNAYDKSLEETGYIRFISEDYLDTLDEESIWRTTEMYSYLEAVLLSD